MDRYFDQDGSRSKLTQIYAPCVTVMDGAVYMNLKLEFESTGDRNKFVEQHVE